MKALAYRKSSRKRRNIIIIAVLIILVVAGVGAYYISKANQEAAQKEAAAKLEAKSSKTSNSAKNEESKDNSDNEGLPENSSTITSDQVPTSSSLSVSITSTSQANGMVNATAKTNGSGTCVFVYSVGDKDKPVTRQVDAQSNSCSSSISQNEFSYIGSPWTLKVTYYSGNNKAEASKNVTIN